MSYISQPLRVFDEGNGADANPIAAPWVIQTAIPALKRLSAGIYGSTASVLNWGVYTNVALTQDQWAECTWGSTFVDGDGGPAVRCDTAANTGYSFSARTVANGGLILERRLAGSTSTLAAIPTQGGKAGDRMRISVQGATVSAYLNGVLIMQVVDGTPLTGRYPGIICFSNTNALISWRAGDILASGQYVSTTRRRRRRPDVGGGYQGEGWFSGQMVAQTQYNKFIVNAAGSTTAAFAGAGVAVASGSAALTGRAQFAAAGIGACTGSASLTVKAAFTASGVADGTASATFNPRMALAGVGATTATGNAALTTAAAFATAGLNTAYGSASLTTSAAFSATANANSSGSAALTVGYAPAAFVGAGVATTASNKAELIAGWGDPYYANVELLLHGDGLNNGVTMTDSSHNALTPTTTSGTNFVTDTSTKKFGTASINFTGGWFRYANNARFQMGSGDFTVEAWVTFNSASAGARVCVFGDASSIGGTPSFYLLKNTSNQIYAGVITSVTTYTITDSSTISVNTPYFVQLRRTGNTLDLIRDGTIVATTTISGALVTNANSFGVGCDGDYFSAGYGGTSGILMMGWLDDFRLTKGFARPAGAPVEAFRNFGTGIAVAGAGRDTDSGSGTLTVGGGSAVAFVGAGYDTEVGSAALTVQDVLAGAGTAQAVGTGVLASNVNFAGAGLATAVGVGALTDFDALAGAGFATAVGSAALTAKAAFAGVGTDSDAGTGALTARDAFAGAGIASTSGLGAFTPVPMLAGTGVASATGVAALTGGSAGANFVGAGTDTDVGSATLKLQAAFTGAGLAVAVGAGTFTPVPKFVGAGVASAVGSAALTTSVPLAGAGVAAAAGTAVLTDRSAFAGAGQADARGSAGLTLQPKFSGGGFAIATGAGTLVAGVSGLAFIGRGQATATGQATLLAYIAITRAMLNAGIQVKTLPYLSDVLTAVAMIESRILPDYTEARTKPDEGSSRTSTDETSVR